MNLIRVIKKTKTYLDIGCGAMVKAKDFAKAQGVDTKTVFKDTLNKNKFFYICVTNTYLKIWPFIWPFYYFNDIKIGQKRHWCKIEKLDINNNSTGI